MMIINDTAAKAFAVMRQNLIWATLYNLIAIPAAAMGLLNPWMSAVGMSLSSVIVVVNALRLQVMPRAWTGLKNNPDLSETNVSFESVKAV